MNVTSITSSVFSAVSPGEANTATDAQSYADIVAQLYSADPYQTRDEVNANDTELTQFKSDLSSKGAAQFLKDLNQDKIDALVEQYRQKLLKEKESNPNQPMDINQMVSDFKKELLKEMMEAQKADQQSKPAVQGSISTSDVLTGMKMIKDHESSSRAETSFLAQMLNPSQDTIRKKADLLF